MKQNPLVPAEEWVAARKRLLAKEKEFTRLRDDLSRERRALPWVKVEKKYVFDTPGGHQTLSDLFEDRSQLVVHHFMFGPDWEEACKSCSFWADNFNGIVVHLNHRDVTLVSVSRAPLEKIQAFRQRMGWGFKWVSSLRNEFNRDFHVSFSPEEIVKGPVYYNYTEQKFPSEEASGFSVFYRDPGGDVFHTYSCYSRGMDMLNGAYHYLDLVPKGRGEEGLPYTMAWLRHHDKYGG
jgi:predicted dithiol-disulfide oxidoreductase (DUF899 family)